MTNITKNFLTILEEIIDATEIIFSRSSLSRKIDRFNGLNRRDFNKIFQRYEKLKYIKKIADNKYEITGKGIRKITDFKLSKKNFNKKSWDGFWRLIIFDIPEKKKSAREMIRRKMKYYNFYPLQKSVFVCPYNCEDAITVLSEFFMISDCVDIIKTRSLGKKEELISKYFDL